MHKHHKHRQNRRRPSQYFFSIYDLFGLGIPPVEDPCERRAYFNRKGREWCERYAPWALGYLKDSHRP